MTEIKAVETLEYIKTFDGMDFGATKIALDMAIEALEEIQQYRAIGTVEECTEAVKNIEHLYMLGRTKAIDEFAEQMKEKWIEADDLSISSEFFEFVDEIAEQMKGSEVDG